MHCFFFPGFHIFFRFGELFLVVLIVVVLVRLVSEPRERYPYAPRPYEPHPGAGPGQFCTRCGSEFRELAAFCANCGAKRG
jgi:hypothetical protein